MNAIHPFSPHNTYSLFNRQRTASYEKLQLQTREQGDVFLSESDASGSRHTAAAFSRQQSLSYERFTLQDNISRSQLRSRNGGDQLDVRASQAYGSYLLVEKMTFRIEEEFGVAAQHTDKLSGRDASIQGAASSVFELSITVYSQYKAQSLESNASANPGDLLNGFMGKMHKAVDRGFDDTVKALEPMKGFNQRIQSVVDTSYSMLKTLLDRFEVVQRERLENKG